MLKVEIQKREEEVPMSNKVVGAEIPRANPRLVQLLIDAGLLFVGEDNQLHVVENKNIPTPPTKAE